MASKPPLKPKPAATGKPPVRMVTKFAPPWETGRPGPVLMTVEQEPDEAYNFSYVPPEKQAIRKHFVAEFVKDFDGANALARLGFNYDSPRAVATRWLKEPFTQYILDRYLREAETDALITRNGVIAGLIREANSNALDTSGAARVSAFGKIAKLLGMEIDRKQVDVRVAGGIMLVPLAASAADWEANAAKAQLALKAGAKE